MVYGKLDGLARATNAILLVFYLFAAPVCMVIGLISIPAHEGFLGFLGWVVAAVISSANLFSGLGLGASVALRRKGRSVLGFLVQFAGVVGIALMLVLFSIFYGNHMLTIN